MMLAIGIFVWLLGLAIGSFLNVVIYRLPRGLSVNQPRRSFCPHCQRWLPWSENIPVLSWLLLRGRCRGCAAPISAQYPLVELLCGLAFVLVHVLLFVTDSRAGLIEPSLPRDAPLLAAWLVLVAALLASSCMDLVSYLIDVSVINVAALAAVIVLALWPRPEFVGPVAESSLGAAGAAAAVVGALWLWLTTSRTAAPSADEPPVSDEVAAGEPSSPGPSAERPRSAALGLTLLCVFLVTSVLLAACAIDQLGLRRTVVSAALLSLLAAMVLAAGEPREADRELQEAIAAEAPSARRTVLSELLWLAPAGLAAGLAGLLVQYVPAIDAAWSDAMHWSPVEGWAPLAGAVFSLHGLSVAVAAGYAIRVIFTLALGREAFGSGDIYILAAIGAAAGWDLVLLAFLCAVVVALAAWILTLFSKRSALIPFGPPLALGALLALWISAPAGARAAQQFEAVRAAAETQPSVLLAMVGILLVGGVGAVALSRLLRAWLEPADEGGGKRSRGTPP